MRAFVINLDRAKDRWAEIESSFAKTGFELVRVSAVDGNAISLPHKDYAEGLYRWFHGRETNRFELACYLSHVAAMQAFLDTNDAHGLICEDDISPKPGLDKITAGAMRHARDWNVLRLAALTARRAVSVAQLPHDSQLCVCLGREKGAGAYVVDRKAASAFVKHLLPMRLPYDHAVDREWFFGLTAMTVTPFPISQTDAKFRSSIQFNAKKRLSPIRRWVATYPYQVFNEIARLLFRGAFLVRLKIRLPQK